MDNFDVSMLVIQRTCAILAFSIHSLLTFLILKYSPKSLGAYKYLLIYISFFELLYAILDVLVSPELFTHKSSFMLVIDSNKTFVPFWMLYPINLLFCGMLGYSMGIFVINFVYRWLAMKGSALLKTFDSPKLIIWITAPLSYGVVWMTITGVTLKRNKWTDEVLVNQFLQNRSILINEIVYVGPNYYPYKGYIDWIPIIGMTVLTMMIFASISAIIYFATKSYQIMNSLVTTSANSARYRTHQSQLLNALVLQALIPFFLMHLPASFVFILPFFSCGQQVFARIFSVTVALYPVLDPLPTIFVVKYYRNAVLVLSKNLFSCSYCSSRPKIALEAASSTAYHVPETQM